PASPSSTPSASRSRSAASARSHAGSPPCEPPSTGNRCMTTTTRRPSSTAPASPSTSPRRSHSTTPMASSSTSCAGPASSTCGVGGHPVKCPLLNVGIQLDAATAAAGQLHMIAGSHLGTSELPSDDQVQGLPTTAIVTEPGDVTAHWGHTLHAAPPPADRSAAGRRAVYVTYVNP